MSEINKAPNIWTMPDPNNPGGLIEGHPLGVSKIIQGDLRKISWVVDGITHYAQKTDGKLLYDRHQQANHPWFILNYESGRRIVD